MLFFLWLCLGLISLGAPALYYFYMKRNALKPWNLKVDQDYQPTVSIIIPTYNEGGVVRYKLRNLASLDYPRDLVQIIVVDSASNDNTMEEIEAFKAEGNLNITVLKEDVRRGKSAALNFALGYAKGEVVVVSDTDCFWPSDILRKALPHLADERIAAVAGHEKLLNPSQSWVTATEGLYRDKMFMVQLGESKTYSTVQFEGGFGAYVKKTLDGFDTVTGSDDSGTALNLVQKGFRTVVLPQAMFYTFFPHTWRGKMTIKVRRAKHLIRISGKSFKLMMRGKLALPKRIVLPQTFLFLVNPLVFCAFVLLSGLLMLSFPPLAILPLILLAIPQTRFYLIEFIQNNLIATLALLETASGKSSIVWKQAEESRKDFDPEILRNRGLIS